MESNSDVLGLEMSLHPQNLQSSKTEYHPFPTKPKFQTLLIHSDDDDPQNPFERNSGDDNNEKRKISPWQRMKWTDNMVKLLIMVVYYIGDEVVSEGNDKKKGGVGVGVGSVGGGLQKKGKWKSVSKAMMERGFFVSPQQCEDKFNDLNKRYKRVNDILGKGISCQVVENPSLLDKLDHLTPKMKEEVKKLLSSKHLFFREMCAYHNTCGHTGSSAVVVDHHPQPQQVQQINSESSDDDNEEHESDNDGEDEDTDERSARKRLKKGLESSCQELENDVMSILQDGKKSLGEKREWVKGKLMGLEEQQMRIVGESFELEKQRFKWMKFSSKKEREMEKEKLMNERLKLENERMVLILRQKELDLVQNFQMQLSSGSRNRKDDEKLGV